MTRSSELWVVCRGRLCAQLITEYVEYPMPGMNSNSVVVSGSITTPIPWMDPDDSGLVPNRLCCLPSPG